MSSEILILQREKRFGFSTDPANTDQIASFLGCYCHSMILECARENRIIEGSLALSNDEHYEDKVLYNEDEYNECWNLTTSWEETGVSTYNIAYRVEKPFFDVLYQNMTSEELLELLSPDSYNGSEARRLINLIPKLDFEHNYYFVLSLGDPQC